MTSAISLGWAWAIGLIGFGAGIAAGSAIGYSLQGSRKRVGELQERLDALQQEFDDYRNQVGSHFLKTSELVQKMTDSYREVYEHLATGSQALCQVPVETPQLDIPQRPTLDRPAEKPPESDLKPFSDGETNGQDDSDSDSCMGDAPRVPTLDTGDASPPKPSP